MSFPEPTRRSTGVVARVLAAAVLPMLLCASASSQSIGVFGEKGGSLPGASAAGAQTKLKVETSLTTDRFEAGGSALLSITVSIPAGFHLYSMDEGYSGRTRIDVASTPGLEPTGEFRAEHPPKRVFDSILDQEVEKYAGRVTWSRVFRIVDPAMAKVAGTLKGTYCSEGEGGQCFPVNEKFAATLIQAAPMPAHANDAVFAAVRTPQVGGKPGPATLRFSLSPENAKPGDEVTLSTTMTLGEGWHTYSLTQPAGPGALPTTFTLKAAQGLTPIGATFIPDSPPHETTLETEEGPTPIEEHSGTVVWTRQFRVDDAEYGIEGSIRYLACEKICLNPQTVAFALGHLDGAGPVPAAIAAEAADPLVDEFGTSDAGQANLPMYLALAFLGGLILNIMPCVLPVVAIKVMSFVQQAGEDRGRVFLLNAVYASGVISVFLFLAALAALPDWFGWVFEALGLSSGRFSWGGLFQSETFNLAMACLVFAMGLSLLGVFEIPIPGMIGSAAGVAQKEGLTGAFLTGIFATLLATPCTGPFMGTTLAWSVKQPPAVTFLVWATMGLGMASPYVLFGLIPGAVKLLPKPGAWMLQFKQFAGFVLMATVVFVLSSVNTRSLMPALVMLLGIALALWLIGMVQSSTSATKRRVVSAAGLALGSAVAIFGYQLTVEPTHKLAWESFSTARLNELRGERKTVLIDFTADWCVNCITNERLALNTEETKAFIEKHGVVALKADYTDYSQEITDWLDRFDRQGIPLTVIFPADRPNEPILLDGLFSETRLLDTLGKAVTTPAVADVAVKTADAR